MIIFLLLLQETLQASAPISLEKILIFLGGSGFLGGVLAVLKIIAERYDKLKERRTKEKEFEISETADLKDIEFKSSDTAKTWLEKILGIRDAEIVRLKSELQKQESDLELNESKFNQIEKELRRVRREFEYLDIYFFKNEKNDNLKKQFGVVRTALDELEKCFQDEKRET